MSPTPSDARPSEFPIQGSRHIRSIPWAAIAPHEKAAQKNFHQSLARLAERGGLSVREALVVLKDGGHEMFANFGLLANDHAEMELLRLVAPTRVDEAPEGERIATALGDKTENVQPQEPGLSRDASLSVDASTVDNAAARDATVRASGCVVCGEHWNNAIHAQESVIASRGHHYAAHRCADCSRTDKHTHCAECGSTEHVASTCDMRG